MYGGEMEEALVDLNCYLKPEPTIYLSSLMGKASKKSPQLCVPRFL